MPGSIARAGGPMTADRTPLVHCPRCSALLIGTARTCVIHGDQLDLGGRAPALETVADQLKAARRPESR